MSGAELLHLLVAAAVLLFAAMLGRWLVRALAGAALAAALGRAGEAGFGFAAGLTLLSLLLGAAYAAGAPVLLAAAAAVLLAVVLARRAHGVTLPATDALPASRGARLALLAGWLLLAALVVVVAVLSCRAAAGFPDAHQVWLLRGKVLFVDGGFDGSYFATWRGAHDNRAYPPLVSFATAGLHEAMGGVDDRAAKLLSVAFFVALLLVAHGALRRSLARGAALAATLGLAVCSGFVMLAIWGIADLPLALHVLCGGVVLLVVDDRRALLRLLALPLVGAVLCKNEGLPAAIALLAAAGLRLGLAAGAGGVARRSGRLLLALAACAAPAAGALGAWRAFAVARGLPLQFTLPAPGAGDGIGRLARARLVLASAGERLADPGWLAGWIAFALVLVLVVARVRGEAARRVLAAGLVVVLLALAYAWVLSGIQGDLPYLLRLSTGRLLAHGYPLALVVAGAGMAALAARRS